MRFPFWRRRRADSGPARPLPSGPSAPTWDGARDAADDDEHDGAAGRLRGSGPSPEPDRAPGASPRPSSPAGPLDDPALDASVGRVPTQVGPLLRALHAGDLVTADRLCAELTVAGEGPAIAAQVAVHGVLAMHLVDEDAEDAGDDELPGGGSASALTAGRALAVRAEPLLARLVPAATPADAELSALLAAGAVGGPELLQRLEQADPVLQTRVAAVLLLADLGTGLVDALVAEVEGIYGAP